MEKFWIWMNVVVIFVLIPLAPLVYFIVRNIQARRLGIRGIPSWWTGGLSLLAILFSANLLYHGFFEFHGHFYPNEAKTNLGAIFTTQVSYFGERNTYANTFALMNWEPEGRSLYTFYTDADVIANTKGPVISYRPNGNWPFTLRPATSATGFTAIAIGNIDNDSFPDAWMINDTKTLVHLFDDQYNEDLTHFFISPPPVTRALQLAKFRDRAWATAENYSPHFFLIIFIVLVISIIRDEVRWRRARRQSGEQRR